MKASRIAAKTNIIISPPARHNVISFPALLVTRTAAHTTGKLRIALRIHDCIGPLSLSKISASTNPFIQSNKRLQKLRLSQNENHRLLPPFSHPRFMR